MRQWAVLQTDESLQPDENDWCIRHSPALTALMGIASWVRSGAVHITLSDLITLEHEFPGMFQDVDKLIWQVLLIKRQNESERHG